NVRIGHASKGEQDEGGALAQSLGDGGRRAQFAEHRLLTFGDHDLGSGTGHGSPLRASQHHPGKVGEGSKTRPPVEARFRAPGLAAALAAPVRSRKPWGAWAYVLTDAEENTAWAAFTTPGVVPGM